MPAKPSQSLSVLRLAGLTSLTLIAFAANSVLGRLGLADGNSDPASFSGLRLFSGALVLLFLWRLSRATGNKTPSKGSWSGAAMLFGYAVLFSYAYLSLTTATGALILFGAVQLTIILFSLFQGYRPPPIEWGGIALAFWGFIYLMQPGWDAPDPFGFMLMLLAGVAWGGYTLIGRESKHPLADTTYNFIRSLPFVAALLISVPLFGQLTLSPQGALYAILSGAVTSGIGYALWYRVLPQLTTTLAAVLQLSVPLIAAIGGVLIVNEALSTRLLLAAGMILGGILLVIGARGRPAS